MDRIAKALRRKEPLALTVLDFRHLERRLSVAIAIYDLNNEVLQTKYEMRIKQRL